MKQPHKIKGKLVPTMAAAASVTGLKIETLKTAKDSGCPAFRSSGNVNIPQLRKWLTKHPDILKSNEDIPDIRLERALKIRAERQRREAENAEYLGDLVSVEKLTPVLAGFIKVATHRMLTVPDRVHQKFAMMTDPLAIKEDLSKEIRATMRQFSEADLKALAKEISAAKAATQ